jgi:hypothetical protein
MIAAMSAESEEVQREFAEVQARWSEAVHAHRVAPPDGGFSARLANLAEAARQEAVICRRAHSAGFEWPPHTAASKQPYELQPGSGRRGPEGLWLRFDAAVAELNRAGAGSDLLDVARAHELLADAAGQLAAEVERQDRASGLLPIPLRRRRSA